MVTLYYPSDYAVKNLHKRIILDLIRFTPGGISRAEIARRVGLTRSAVSSIVNDFIRNELVIESGPDTGGRRPVILEFNPDRGRVAGIDLGVTHLGIVITDFAAHVLCEDEIPFEIEQGPEASIPIIDAHLFDLLRTIKLTIKDVLAIGIGVPGPVIADAGLVSAPPIMPGWDNYPIRSLLEELWRVPVALENDADLGALGEWAYGAGRGERNLAYIKAGSGIGAGLFLDGHIYRGSTGSAGEIGHITIQENGPRCSCGNYGCLEAMAGGQAIARRAREVVESGRRTLLANIQPTKKITAKDVASAARMGDLAAQQILSDAGTYLGIAVASLVNLFNPSVVVVGGDVSNMGDLLLEPIRQTLRARSLRSAVQTVRVSSAVLGRRSSSIGAIVQAINLVLNQMTNL